MNAVLIENVDGLSRTESEHPESGFDRAKLYQEVLDKSLSWPKTPTMIRFAFGLAFLLTVFASCNNAPESSTQTAPSLTAEEQLERDLEMYENVWFEFLNNGDTLAVNAEHFTEDVTIITDQGNIVGIEGVRQFYMNYLNGFSEIEFTIVDAFGQGDKIVKHWNFKGTHTGSFFGIPATGNKLDLSGTTLVTMRDGRVASEQDFFDMKSMLDQLQKAKGEVNVDDYAPGTL